MTANLNLREKERNSLSKVRSEEEFYKQYDKIISDRASIHSIRGNRYFGPSKMNFFDLMLHSLSIMAVFKGIVIIRSLTFLIFYIYFIFNDFSIITSFPVIIVLILIRKS